MEINSIQTVVTTDRCLKATKKRQQYQIQFYELNCMLQSAHIKQKNLIKCLNQLGTEFLN